MAIDHCYPKHFNFLHLLWRQNYYSLNLILCCKVKVLFRKMNFLCFERRRPRDEFPLLLAILFVVVFLNFYLSTLLQELSSDN